MMLAKRSAVGLTSCFDFGRPFCEALGLEPLRRPVLLGLLDGEGNRVGGISSSCSRSFC